MSRFIEADLQTFTVQINEGELPLYQEAGDKSGYQVDVLAQAGESIEGHVCVTIKSPVRGIGHYPFYRKLSELRISESEASEK